MKPICGEIEQIWPEGPGTKRIILKLNDDRVKESEEGHISFIASNELGPEFEKGDHVTITIRKVSK